MIKSLLVANRGEIAVRIMRTCQKLGIRAVAVYSEADRYARHVAQADEAVLIGPAESAQSYLKAENIIAAAKQTGVEAIHPGYGFLSESEALISLCEQEGIIFVGPNRQAIRLMGSKIESKALAQNAGVPTIPGYHGADQSAATLLVEGDKVGYPLMIKASAGGGGKGMRRVDNSEQLVRELPQAKQEALAGFGDDKVLLEKLIEEPRHIEVQLAADHHGNSVHLFERECSIQRNHQKVIEEAPAGFLSDAQRQVLFASAITLGQAVNYDSLGTVEFLLDQSNGEVYFLEMNTRLQVEHPVTEAITGFDLVEWQIRIAAGEKLPRAQADIHSSGWAIEARVNAEDPANNYRPQTGTIAIYNEPEHSDVRVDSGVQKGSVLGPYYDPMLAKVIGIGDNRERARSALQRGIDNFTLSGVGNNLGFLGDILRHPNFVDKALTTRFLEESFSGGWQAANTDNKPLICAAVARIMLLEQQDSQMHNSPFQSLGAFRVLDRAGLAGKSRVILKDKIKDTLDTEGGIHLLTISGSQGRYQLSAQITGADDAKSEHRILAGWIGEQNLQVEIDGHTQSFSIDNTDAAITLTDKGTSHHYLCLSEQDLALGKSQSVSGGDSSISASLPGQVVEIKVATGDSVTSGDTLVVLDSMKLLHNLTAATDGVVGEIFCSVGDSVEGGAILIELEPGE
ncbi:MAG: biotin/lipoyl-binding protein [Gammaproteobacteria bacterium]|nr:biotin/lipoyl-binding protein [Gammaproteobacteria bacterium]MBQ0839564.1 biotin/lipoyl-binding protein [Gammaproteobacteria bacterium]